MFVSTTISSPAVCAIIFSLPGSIVKLFVSNVPSASIKDTASPYDGDDGNVIVIAPPLVSTKILSPARAVYADVFSI